jgi:4-carboxymuconolactone decarboxylase
MAISDLSERISERCFLTEGQEDGGLKELKKTDPEFIELFDNFAFDEVIHMPEIGGKEVDDKTRHMAILATLLGCQGIDRVFPFLHAVNDFLTEKGIALPLEGQSQATPENRLEKGSLRTEGTDHLLLPVCTGRL